MHQHQVAIVGAGPIGLEVAVALRQHGVDYVHLEAGQVAETISWFPRQMKFFSSPERIGIAGVPLQTADQSKATREEYLAYLRGIVRQFDLNVNTYERVTDIGRSERGRGGFVLTTTSREGERSYRAERVVLAYGDLHRPRKLGIPGEDLPHVSHYFDEPHRYFRQRLLVVGGRNSAVEAALRCHAIGAEVSISYRRDAFPEGSVKYWLLPEIKLLSETGQLQFHSETLPTAITSTHVTLRSPRDGSEKEVPADFVLLLTGYEQDSTLYRKAGVELAGENASPVYDEATMETNVLGIYVAGTGAAGTQNKFSLFIENCHTHVDAICRAIVGKPPLFDARNKTNATLAQITAMPES